MKPIGANDYADNGAWNAATNTATPVESTGKSTPKVAPYAAGPTAGGPGSPYAAKETGPSVSHGSMDTQAMLATSAGLLAGFALVALGAACIAATAGICAGFVGPAAIVFVGAISGAGASMTQYHFEPGEKSAEGYRDSFSHGGWWGLAFGGAGIAGAALGKASVAGAPVAGLSTQASSAAQKAVAVLSDARVVSGRFPHSAGPDEVLMRVGADGRVTNYQVYGSDGLPVKRVDVTGKAHGGVATPHVVDFERHVNPVTGQIFVRPAGSVRPTTAEELAGVESF